MNWTMRTAVGLCTAGALATATGCTNTDERSDTSATSVAVPSEPTAATPTRTSSPPPAADAATQTPPVGSPGPTAGAVDDDGQRQAAEAVEQAWATLDEVSQDPDVEVQELAQVARGQAVAQWVSNTQIAREEGLVQTGDTRVTVVAVETVTEGERYAVTACLDWSEVMFNGVKPDRGELGDAQQITYVVRPDAGGPELFVTEDPMEYEACDG